MALVLGVQQLPWSTGRRRGLELQRKNFLEHFLYLLLLFLSFAEYEYEDNFENTSGVLSSEAVRCFRLAGKVDVAAKARSPWKDFALCSSC